jgi:tetratricopeptide (TPR) repeat protein
VVTMATAEVTLEAGENVLDTATKTPDWRRWNNYGVALLDQRQFALAAEVFAHVSELDETYRPWAETNRALALIELDRYGEAARLIEDVIGANPPQPALDRALFQQARVFLKLGRLAEAETNLRRVLSDYPSDRQSWRQLGELCKLKRDYVGARHCYEQILGIDPEDTGAHYNLIFIYRQLSLTQAAQREAAIFADLKDDQTTFAVANEFLRSRPEINNESVPFHIHDLNR